MIAQALVSVLDAARDLWLVVQEERFPDIAAQLTATLEERRRLSVALLQAELAIAAHEAADGATEESRGMPLDVRIDAMGDRCSDKLARPALEADVLRAAAHWRYWYAGTTQDPGCEVALCNLIEAVDALREGGR